MIKALGSLWGHKGQLNSHWSQKEEIHKNSESQLNVDYAK